MKYQARTAPDWLARNAIYQVNPRTFSEQGTLDAVTQALPELHELGFRVVYLCPVFAADPSADRAYWSVRQKKSGTENPKNPYRMGDYFAIDEEYGTMDDLRALVDGAHALGMRVILDLVYLHIGPGAPILRTHPEFAKQDAQGRVQLTRWYFAQLDFNSPGLREYLWSNMTYYIGVLDVDGFRCDVGDEIPIDFWREGRRRMQAIKPDAVLINEGINWSYLADAFDACYYFRWHETLYRIFGGVADGTSGWEGAATLAEMRREATPAQLPAGGLIIRDIDNHDTVTDWPARIETVAGHAGMELIEVINYLIDGIPMVYCGNELADAANLNMFANRFHRGGYAVSDRSIAAQPYSQRRQQVMRQLNELKRTSDVLRHGSTRFLPTDADDKVLAFTREYDGQAITLLGNVTEQPLTVAVACDLSAPVCMGQGYTLADGRVTLQGHGYLVLQGV